MTSRSGDVRARDRVIAVVALGAPLALVIALHAWAWSGWRDTRPWPDGVRLVATVVDRDTSDGPRADLHRVTVLVPADDEVGRSEQRVQFEVDRATYDAAASGEVEVEVDGTDAARVRIPRNAEWTGRLLIVGLVDLLLVGAAFQIRRSVGSDR